jgi:molybdate transport system permease protein
VLALATAGALVVVLPIVGLLTRVPWRSLARALTSSEVGDALRLSMECSLGAVAVSAVLGVPLAWLLARAEFAGRSLVRAIVILPMVLPPVVGGVGLLDAFGRHGLTGRLLAHLPSAVRPLPFTTPGVVLAEAFVAMPFLVITTEAGLRQLDRRYEDVAATLGAGPGRRFLTVSLPLVLPSLAAGAALCWARALGEFGATITFAGNLPGRTQTAPLAIFFALERSQPATALGLSVVLLAVSVAVLGGLRDRWLLRA